MFAVLFTVIFASALAHDEYHAVCPLDFSAEHLTQNLFDCFEQACQGSDPNGSCIDEALVEIRGLDEECNKCIEHFLEDHLMDEVSKCPTEYLSEGDRQGCVSLIVASMQQHCY